MAMEDAYILSNLLADISNAQDIGIAFKTYDAIRRPRSQRLVTSSREAGEVYHLEGTPLGDEDALRENLENRYKWIWNHDQKQELAEALALLAKERAAAAQKTADDMTLLAKERADAVQKNLTQNASEVVVY